MSLIVIHTKHRYFRTNNPSDQRPFGPTIWTRCELSRCKVWQGQLVSQGVIMSEQMNIDQNKQKQMLLIFLIQVILQICQCSHQRHWLVGSFVCVELVTVVCLQYCDGCLGDISSDTCQLGLSLLFPMFDCNLTSQACVSMFALRELFMFVVFPICLAAG